MAPPISVDDADNIRRFIAMMPGGSTTTNPTMPQAVHDTTAQQDSGETTDSGSSTNVASTHSSPPIALAHDMQSPQARGVLAPPPTPEVSLGNVGIGQLIHDHIEGMPGTFTLGDSRYAPKTSSKLGGARPPVPPGVYVASSPKTEALSPEERNAHNMSFSRMSFVTSEQPRVGFPGILSKTAYAGSIDPSASGNGKNDADQNIAINIPVAESSSKYESKEKATATDKPVSGSINLHEAEKNSPMDTHSSDPLSPQEVVEKMTTTPPHLRSMRRTSPTDTPVSRSHSRQELMEKNIQTEAQRYLQEFKEKKAATDKAVSKPTLTPPHLRTAKGTSASVHSVVDTEIPWTPLSEPKDIAKEDAPSTSLDKLTLDETDAPKVSKTDAAETPKARSNYSPSKGTAAAQAAKKEEELKNSLYFKSWPTLEKRDQPAARARKVILTGLPPASSPVFVSSLVFGGPLEQIHLAGPATAIVHFLNPDDTVKFYNGTSNGIECQKEGIKYTVFTEMDAAGVDVVGGKLRQWIDSNMTRCVRAIGVDADMTLGKLYGLAEAKGRKVEVIEVGENPSGLRSVIFRFLKIDHAVDFKASISRLDEWEHCNIHFAPDPCAEVSKASISK